MKNPKMNPNAGATHSVPQTARKVNDFETVKRTFETAHASGADYSAELMELATAIAFSVLRKCLDPQRKTAPQREQVSNNGQNPALMALRGGITGDNALLESTRRNANAATRTGYNDNGEPITEVANKAAQEAIARLIDETLSDGIDLVQEAATAILEQAREHAKPGANWLDMPYTIRRLSKRVYIKFEDSAAYRDDETTPMREAFREVRRLIMNSRAIQTDPRNGYSYIEEFTEDGLDTIYLRMGKYADLGGYDSNGNYTANERAARICDKALKALNLTPRQKTIMELRMRGYGYGAIATYLGVTDEAIGKTVRRIRQRALDIGLTPEGLTGELKPKAPANYTAIAVAQVDINGSIVARYESIGRASAITGIDRKGISDVIKGKRKTAGGYSWKYDN